MVWLNVFIVDLEHVVLYWSGKIFVQSQRERSVVICFDGDILLLQTCLYSCNSRLMQILWIVFEMVIIKWLVFRWLLEINGYQ